MNTEPEPTEPVSTTEPPVKRGRGRPPGGVGTVNRVIDYRCMDCDEVHPRDDLLAKQVNYNTIGKGGKIIKSRIVGWVCRPCAAKQPEWNMDRYSSAPGMRGTKIAKP